MKNLFIVFDGIDGSGKGEMIKRLADYLFSLNLNVFTTREPSQGEYGKQIRKILAEEKDPNANAENCFELYVKDRKDHLEKEVEPFLSKGNVICDRYYYSTIVYQNVQGIDAGRVIEANKGFRKPDIVFILDLPAEVALERIGKVRSIEKFEKQDFLENVRQGFLKLKEKLDNNIKIIDASKSKSEVFNQIKKEIESYFEACS